MDLTLELTFFEEWSARERRAMDADGDGRLTPVELGAYLRKLSPDLARRVTLRIAGREAPLAPLYDPEVELLGNERAIPGHHRLRLFFFAPTPPSLRAKDELVIEDRLWPGAEALATVTVEGKDGGEFAVEETPAREEESPRSGNALRFMICCLQPPAAGSGSPEPSTSGTVTAPSGPPPR